MCPRPLSCVLWGKLGGMLWRKSLKKVKNVTSGRKKAKDNIKIVVLDTQQYNNLVSKYLDLYGSGGSNDKIRVLKESEFNAKVNELREKIKSYNEFKNNKNNDLKKLRDNAAKKILDILNTILGDYSAKNSISLIIDKKNIIIGKSELDVTNQIMELLNKKIKKIDLK